LRAAGVRRSLLSFGVLALLGLVLGQCAPAAETASGRWYRGNTHTHTLWSDGNAAPELVTKFYVDEGYDFLVLSDHNLLSQGERWFPVGAEGRLTPEKVAGLVETFGEDQIELRAGEAPAMRLRTLDELRQRFCAAGEFLMIQGEEVTDSWNKLPVHINAVNIERVVPPQGGESVSDTIERNFEAILAEGERSGRTVFAHLNHPNFGWGVTVQEVAAMKAERFFEVYNGHSGVRNYGDAEHPSLEVMWDIALTLRLEELDLGLLYGVATDDSHDYYAWGVGKTNPGRGWVMVRAERLEANTIVGSMKAGDFYASTGVELEDFGSDEASMRVEIAAKPGVVYTTRFIGTLGSRRDGQVGITLAETTDNPAIYPFGGDELYVRAKVVSSEDHPNPFAAGDKQCAWVQPVDLRSRSE
jgi:hypothetical protein